MGDKLTRRKLLQAGLGAGALLAANGAEAVESKDTVENKPAEVRYEYLKPLELIERRKAAPVGYLPIGCIEWHWNHNPLGLDALKAHCLCIRCAQKTGGVVFPPLWYGENRINGTQDKYQCEKLGVTPEHFGPDFTPYSIYEQAEHYQQMLIHILNQMASVGFSLLIICAGHYPLLDHARAALSVFRQTSFLSKLQPTGGWAFTGYELVKDLLPEAGDHGGPWETSIQMALEPGTVDLSLLPPDEGWSKGWKDKTSVEYGQKAIDAIVMRVTEKVADLRANPWKYLTHDMKW